MARHLVQKHLENVSGDLIAEYKDLIAQHARGKCGVYVLYNNGQMYYVGLASNLNARLNQHMKDRHKGKWDRFSMYLTQNDSHMRELEALLHRVLRPKGNKQIGRLQGSEDLRRPLKKAMQAKQRAQIDALMGDRVRATSGKRTSIRKIAATQDTDRSLEGLVDRATTIKGWYLEYEYTARLRKNGTIRYDNQNYDTPSGAGRAARRQSTNGWRFWHMRDDSGDWVQLREFYE